MFQLIDIQYFGKWKSLLKVDLMTEFSKIENQVLDSQSFTFCTSVSVMSSLKIKGEKLDVDSYVNHKILQTEFPPELIEKPNDLFKAYLFAKDNKLTVENFLKAHKIVSEHYLPKNLGGTLRKSQILMQGQSSRNQYEATQFALVEEYFEDFWDDIETLLDSELNIEHVFYFAAFIHLMFMNIQAFSGANACMARLLEKWFLVEKLGSGAWFIPSERYYYENVKEYFHNIDILGSSFHRLDYSKSIPFLQMLPKSILNAQLITNLPAGR